MSIAIGLSLAREWRGSLITAMTMHGLNNGIMLLMLLLLL
jgi:membrane protease YdiL (CAAX protease family)